MSETFYSRFHSILFLQWSQGEGTRYSESHQFVHLKTSLNILLYYSSVLLGNWENAQGIIVWYYLLHIHSSRNVTFLSCLQLGGKKSRGNVHFKQSQKWGTFFVSVVVMCSHLLKFDHSASWGKKKSLSYIQSLVNPIFLTGKITCFGMKIMTSS